MTLRGREHGQAIHGLGIVGNHRFQQGAEVSQIALDGRRSNSEVAYSIPPTMLSARFLQRERQIELGHSVRRRLAEAAAPVREVQVSLRLCSARRT